MIDSVTIHGFKSFIDLNVELGAFNVFIGANGSGKSNLLEAIGAASAAVFGSVEPETLRYRGIRLGTVRSYKDQFKDRTSRKLSINSRCGKARYSVSFRAPTKMYPSKWRFGREILDVGNERLLDRLDAKCVLYSQKHGSQPIDLSLDQSAAMLALKIQSTDVEDARNLLSTLETYAIYSPMTLVMRGLMDDVSRDPLGLGGSGLTEAVRDLLSEDRSRFGAFDIEDIWEMIEWADDVNVIPSSRAPVPPALKSAKDVLVFRDRFKKPGYKRISAYDASEGALYVMFLLALASHPRMRGTFAVDNFDHALHPRVACKLTSLVSHHVADEGDRQLLVTTHNPLVLDGLDLLDDRIRLFAVDRDPDGVSQVRRITVTPEILDHADKGLGLSRLWLMGRLGGVPQLL
jgi:predicted ATPase